MIEVYSNNLAVNAGSTISFSNSTKTNSNISLSGSSIAINRAGTYKVTFTGNFVATAEGIAGVQLYTNGSASVKGIAQSTVAAAGTTNLSFVTTVQVATAPTGNVATLTFVNSIAGTWNLADVIVERLA